MQGLVKVLPEESLNKYNHQAKHLDDTMLDNQDIRNPFNHPHSDPFNKQSNKKSFDNALEKSFEHIENLEELRSAKPLLIQPKYSAQSLEEQFQRIKVIST